MCVDASFERRIIGSLLLVTVAVCMPCFAKDSIPISLHPDNPHYFLWHGKPTVLITSGEHYGAVLNLDFDYVRYLEELRKHGLNHTRAFSGSYVELPDSYITDNPLGPKPSRYTTPWARSEAPGYKGGGNKFDLNQWNPAYFNRLKDFMSEASRRGVVVEMTLFCTLYDDARWKLCPMNAENNINGIGACSRQEVFRLVRGELTEVQIAFVRRMAQELRDFDNLFYEVCNEPYIADGVSCEWQQRIVDTLVEEEKKLGVRHLISMNIANKRAKVEDPDPDVSILNFHYCYPPDTVSLNYHLGKVIGENETGFRGKEDLFYRTEGWDFILAGGALYNNLDWSFTPSDPEGDLIDQKAPGGGSREIRKQLGILKTFIEDFDFVRMLPSAPLIKDVSPVLSVQALAEAGKAYAVYLHVPIPANNGDDDIKATLTIELPAGHYNIKWVDTKTGKITARDEIRHEGGAYRLLSPSFANDIALSIRRS